MAETGSGETIGDKGVVDNQEHLAEEYKAPLEDKPKDVVLTIALRPDGRTIVNGPIADKILAYGMLASAQDAIRKFHEQLDRANTPVKQNRLINYLRGKR